MGRNLFVQILKMIGVLLLFALLVLIVLSAFPALSGPVESTSSYTVSNQDSMTASGQSSQTSSAQSDGDGDGNSQSADASQSQSTGKSQSQSTHTVTNTTTEEMLLEKYNWIVWVGALLLTLAAFLIDANNRTQRYKAEIPKHAANIDAATEKCDRLLSQANRFVDKYSTHESDVMKTVATARNAASAPRPIRKSADFRFVLENYPSLLANQNTQLLLSQLERSEAAVLSEKNAYNDAVAKYNTEIHTFPFSTLRKALKLQDHACYPEHRASEPVITDDMLGI